MWSTACLVAVSLPLTALFVAAQQDTVEGILERELQSELPPGVLQELTGEDVVVNTKYGRVVGKRRPESIDVGGVTNTTEWFLGIPYAKPPVGKLRFRHPLPPDPWGDEALYATQFGWVCPQPPDYLYANEHIQDEDCLHLNVYVPYEPSRPNRTYPVMFFIHGGSYFVGGSTIYSGHVPAMHGVVIVTINYRLGMLGFFSAGHESLSGNFGLYDQVMALRWVRDNIRAFRGDPNRVTIYGNSAGGSSVGLLVLSPVATGLFQGAITQSGSPLAFWAVHNDSVELGSYARSVASELGCTQPEVSAMADCMRTQEWKDIIKIQHESVTPRMSSDMNDYKPCVDGHLVPASPLEQLQRGRINRVRQMIGTVRDEWTRHLGWFLEDLYEFVEGEDLDKDFDDGMDRATFESGINHVVTKRFGWDQTVAEVAKNRYTNWGNVHDPIENRKQYIHFFTDLSMIAPSVQTATYLHRHGLPVFMYTFNHHGQHTDPYWWGVFHSVELNYLFGAPFTGRNVDEGGAKVYTDDDRDMSRLMMKLWSNFAKYGDPTPPPGKEGHVKVAWREYQSEASDYLHIDTNDTYMRKHLRADKVAFWNELVPRLRRLAESRRDNENNNGNSNKGNLPIRNYKTEMCVFLGIAIVLLVLLLISLVVLMRLKNSPEKHEVIMRVNGVPSGTSL